MGPVKNTREMFRLLAVALAGYLLAVALAAWSGYAWTSRRLLADLDRRLHLAAISLRHILPDDFHDRAKGPEAINANEDWQNIDALSRFAKESGVGFIYSLIEYDGRFVIVSSSASEKERREDQVVRYFTPFEEAQKEFFQALRTGESQYFTHTDRWGTFRAVAVPMRSPKGRPYLACADVETDMVRALLRRNILWAVCIGLLFALGAVPVFLLYRRSYRDYLNRLGREAEDAIEQTRNLRMYKALLENAFDGVSVGRRDKITLKRQLVWCNDPYVTNSGYPRDVLMNQSHISDLFVSAWASNPLYEEVHDPASPDLRRIFRRRGEGGWKRPDGHRSVIEWQAVGFDYGNGDEWIVTVDRDVTEQRRAAERIEESERLHRTIVENAFDGINVALWDEATKTRRLLSCNERYVEMSGFSREELLAMKNLNDHVSIHYSGEPFDEAPGDASLGIRRIWRTHGVASWKRSDGRENYYQWHAAHLEYDDGVHIIGADRDITDQRLALRALEESERLHRTIVDTAFDGINVCIQDSHTGKRRLVTCNERFVQMSGRTREELMAADDLNVWVEGVERGERVAVRTGVWRLSGVSSWKRPDGRENYFEWNATLHETENGIRLIGADRDITERVRVERERKELEAKVQHTQKLESLGVLAGGIAHDFNNLLIGVLGNADLALRDLPQTSSARGHLRSIETAAKRAADLCRQMLAYSGKGRFVLEAVDLSDIVLEMGQLLSVSVSKRVVIHYDLTKDLPAIEADATQLRQVIMNLITNASEAIGDRSGTIRIVTGTQVCDAEYLRTTYLADQLREGTYVCLEVLDSGCGMDEATRERIFEPFFSTKFTGRGLGMAAVLGIVRGHGGAIKVYSEPGKGSAFRILFPVCAEAVVTPKEQTLRNQPWLGSGKVLVADDEEVVRDVATAMLRRMGFDVLTARDGREALDIFNESPDEIVFVLLDMTMPRMGGEEAFREIRRCRPGARIILSSGYNEQEVVSRFSGKGLAGFVQKPYQSRSLMEVVRRTLGV